jgi:hypothetical protein
MSKSITKTKRQIASEKIALRHYNHILHNVVEPLLGKESTLSTDLERVGKKLLGAKFKGVYASDKIPKLNDLACYCIVNVDRSNEPGSHWMSIAKDTEGDGAILYDSFGRKNTKIIPSLRFTGNGRIIDTDKDAEQKKSEDNCGSRSMAWIILYDTFGRDAAMLI